MSRRIGFLVYKDWREVLNDFDDKQYRELMEAIFDLGFEKKETATSPLVKVAMKLIKPQILRDWEKYGERCNRNRANGLQGGRPKIQKNPENPMGYSETQKTHSVISVLEKPKKPTRGEIINNKKEIEKEDIVEESKDSLSVITDSGDRVNYAEIVKFYNDSAKGRNITQCLKLTEKRRAAIRARVKEYGASKVYKAITKVAQSSFCNGRNDRNWKADIDFVFNANKMARILEGKYDDRNSLNNEKSRINCNSNEQNARNVGEKVLGDIFAEIEERRRIEGVAG